MTAATPSLITMPSAPASKGRQRPRGEKACVLLNAIGERVLDRVHAAQYDHVGRAGPELADGHVQGRQRRAAGSVHRVVGATQVEPVGNAARGHVEEESRE